jgi:hypothetical protein
MLKKVLIFGYEPTYQGATTGFGAEGVTMQKGAKYLPNPIRGARGAAAAGRAGVSSPCRQAAAAGWDGRVRGCPAAVLHPPLPDAPNAIN